jgi:chromate transporter
MKAKSEDQFKTDNVALKDILWTFFRIGMFTLGGGLAMSTVMRHELVSKNKWLEDDEFIALMSFATVVPGAIAVNLAYLLGRRLRGLKGSVTAVGGTVLPSFLTILIIVGLFLPFFDQPKVAAFFRGSGIAIVGQLAFAGLIFARKLLRNHRNFIVCIFGLIPVALLGLHPIWTIVTASIAGYWLCVEVKNEGADR